MSSQPLALLDLPDELLLHTALQCDGVADVARFARTCTALHTLITHTDHFWSLMLARHFDVRSEDNGDGDDDAVGDHRALFREQCMRIQWAIPAYVQTSLLLGEEPHVVRYTSSRPSATPSAYTVRPLPAHGLSAFRVMLCMPAINCYHIGLVAFDAEDDAEWTQQYPPAGRLRAFAHDACGDGELVHPNTDCRGDSAHPVHKHRPVFMPANWSCGREKAAATAFGWAREQWVTMVVDADRGRVFYSLGETGVFLIAFDDGRLAHLRNLRVYVTLINQGAWARIERVRVTDALRAALRAVDAEYADSQRAGK